MRRPRHARFTKAAKVAVITTPLVVSVCFVGVVAEPLAVTAV
jgi:hypothetical protein